MKLYYTRTWEAEISEKDILNECRPYFNINFSTGTREQKNHIINIITDRIIDKYSSYEFSQLPRAFLKPLKEQVKQYLEAKKIITLDKP